MRMLFLTAYLSAIQYFILNMIQRIPTNEMIDEKTVNICRVKY